MTHEFATILETQYQHRFKLNSDTEDLDRAIEFSGKALAMSSKGDENIAAFEFNYGNCLHLKFDRYGDIGSLLKAIEIYENAIKKASVPKSLLIQIVNNIARALASRFDLVHDRADLDQAVGLCTMIENLFERSPSQPSIPAAVTIPPTICLTNLGTFLMKRYRLFGIDAGEHDDLHRAIRLFDQLANDGASEQALGAILGQGQALRLRAVETEVFVQVCNRAPSKSRARRLALTDLGLCLVSRYRISNISSDLEDAIKAHSAALSTMPLSYAAGLLSTKISAAASYLMILW